LIPPPPLIRPQPPLAFPVPQPDLPSQLEEGFRGSYAFERELGAHGVRVVEHFDASRCFEEPDGVVREFLDILARS
jgi:hypothetical protein